jgi:hypothetical protein
MFVIDLYPREGPRPTDFGSALSRKTDLLFANQTYLRLDAYRRELLLRKEIARLTHQSELGSKSAIILLSYHPTPDEAGSERPFDHPGIASSNDGARASPSRRPWSAWWQHNPRTTLSSS